MAFLPEGFDTIAESRQAAVESAEAMDGPIISAYRKLAKECDIWISLGGFKLKVFICSILRLSSVASAET